MRPRRDGEDERREDQQSEAAPAWGPEMASLIDYMDTVGTNPAEMHDQPITGYGNDALWEKPRISPQKTASARMAR
jgi:hypothetical protein